MEGPLPRRVVHLLSIVDSRRLVPARARLDVTALGQGLAWVAVGAAGLLGLVASSHQRGAAFWIARWGSGVVLVYAAVAALYRLLAVGYRALGFDVPPLHLAPILSRSVQELWGERWARPISDWLGDTFFKPYARRRRPLTGVLLAFAVSAAFHAYAVWISLGFVDGLAMGACMFAYFVAQGAIMKLERMAGVRRWTPWAGHAWTAVWMLALAPGFVEPIVQGLGFRGRGLPEADACTCPSGPCDTASLARSSPRKIRRGASSPELPKLL